MRPYSIAGLVLIVLGILALSIRSFTYWSTEQVTGPLGFFSWNVDEPYTVFISPLAGIAALAVGIVLVVMSRRPTATQLHAPQPSVVPAAILRQR